MSCHNITHRLLGTMTKHNGMDLKKLSALFCMDSSNCLDHHQHPQTGLKVEKPLSISLSNWSTLVTHVLLFVNQSFYVKLNEKHLTIELTFKTYTLVFFCSNVIFKQQNHQISAHFRVPWKQHF